MAEFIIGSPLRKLAREHEPLRQFLWRLDYALLWTLEKFLTALPIDMSSRMGARIGGFVGPMMKRKTEIFRGNFATAFPELNDHALDRLVRDAWARAGRILAEYPHLAEIKESEHRLQIEIRKRVPTYDDPSQPCVLVSAHQSNWEVAGASLGRLKIPNASLYTPPTNPMLDRLLHKSREALDCKLLPRDNSARLLLKALKEGRTAAMIIDRRVDEGKPIRFFGHDKMTTITPAKLALKCKCPMVPLQVIRLQDANFRVILHAPIEPRNPDADETEQAIDMTQQLHEQFEAWIREKPEDWFCSKRLWAKKGKIQPGSGDAVADTGSQTS